MREIKAFVLSHALRGARAAPVRQRLLLERGRVFVKGPAVGFADASPGARPTRILLLRPWICQCGLCIP